jgi:hypothetical protein
MGLNFTQTKPHRIKHRCYGEHLEEHFLNPLGTRWEHIGNKEGKKKIHLPLPPQKEKNWTVHECMLSLSIGCMKFLFTKLFVTIFT